MATPAFYLLVGLLLVFAAMYVLLRRRYPRRRRGVEGYFEAAGVDLAFLTFSAALVLALAWHDPVGNRTSLALYRVVLSGYWLTFAIPIVTVGSSVDSRSRGGVPWLIPSLAAAVLLFALAFTYYYTHP